MNIISKASFNGHSLPVIQCNNDVWFSAEHIGLCLELARPRDAILKIYKRNEAELSEYSVTTKMVAADGKQYEQRVFNEEGVMIITMLSRQPKAAEFRKWAVQILKSHRHDQAPAIAAPADQMIISKDEYIAMLKDKISLMEASQPRKRKPFTDEERTKIAALHNQGVSVCVIGKQLGRNQGSISSLIRSWKVES